MDAVQPVPGIPIIVSGAAGAPENEMSKGRDTQNKESKKKPAKSLKEKRADKAAKRSGEFAGADRIHKAVDGKTSRR